MPDRSWKANERSWKSIGAVRTPSEGQDCSHPLFSIECKQRSGKNYPRTLRKWFEQAARNAPPGKIPLLAIHRTFDKRGNDLVVMRRSDFEDLLGRIGKEQR